MTEEVPQTETSAPAPQPHREKTTVSEYLESLLVTVILALFRVLNSRPKKKAARQSLFCDGKALQPPSNSSIQEFRWITGGRSLRCCGVG